MPTGDEMYQLLNALDLTYKAEMILYQLQSILIWVSVLEISMFISLIILFLAAPSKLVVAFLTVPHLPRGIIGLALVVKYLPKSHDIVDGIDLEDIPQSQLSIETVAEKIKFSLSI